MAAIWMRFRAELRSRWSSWLALSVLVGLFGGAVVAAAAGAGRTDSVVDRFVQKKDPPHIFFVPFFGAGGFPPEIAEQLTLDGLLGLDSVEDGERLLLMPAQGEIEVGASDDPRLGTATFPANVIEGRLPDPRRADEAFVNIVASDRYGLHPGDTYTVGFLGRWFGDDVSPPPPGPTITFRITGVGAHLGDFGSIAGPSLTLTPAFLEKYGREIEGIELSMLRLKDGAAGYDGYEAEISDITEGRSVIYTESGTWDETRDSFGLQATALWILSGLLGVLTVLVVGQAIARQTFLESTDNGTLAALGLSQGQLTIVALLRSAWIGLVGAIVAVVVAAAASPLTPFGSARLADPDPAFSIPALPMSLGFGGIFLAVFALAMYPAVRTARRGWEPDASSGAMSRPVRLVEAITRIARKPAPSIGARMAFERGRGRTAVPVRTTIAGTAVCLLALAAALVVGSSLDRLSADPSLYGWNWDASVVSHAFNDDPENTEDGPVAQQVLREMNGIAAVTFGPEGGAINVNGLLVEPYGLPLGATVTPPILEGRHPEAPNEIAIGRQTMRDANASLGDTVRIGFQGSTLDAPFKVVGVTVLPVAGDTSTLGEGIWIPIDDLERLFGQAIPIDRALVRYEPGLDPTQLERFIEERFEAEIRHAESPGTVLDFGRVSEMPLVLAGIVAVLAAGTLGHGLLTAIRRRRRDLSILKTIGFDGRQIRSAVNWQATATALPTLAIGLSLGVIVGRFMWNAMARSTGFVARPVVELSALGIVAVAALIIVNLIALIPGRAAARTQPAVVLRTE